MITPAPMLVWAVYHHDEEWWALEVLAWDDEGTPFVWDYDRDALRSAINPRIWGIVGDACRSSHFRHVTEAIHYAQTGEWLPDKTQASA